MNKAQKKTAIVIMTAGYMGRNMAKLFFLGVLLLLTTPSVYAGSCSPNPGAVWAAHSDMSKDSVFNLGERVYILGDGLTSVANTNVDWTITDQDAGKIVVASGTVYVDSDGDFFIDSGWDIPTDAGAGHDYRLNVVSCDDGDDFKTKKDSFETIPEFTTVALPGLIALGGYLALRRRKK